ncbi:type II restriction enzyme [Anaerobranca californiensis DSM 14826]|jgi:type II restriction enzyme|uniref:Type-2 restriction enzyme n=1 Tax=Anaerobranca californiensis DSM 14826 TaxID=1120989 RepID=A0A1M6RAQ0_9FIRM|nr:type II restriction endonuclease [Anaerobranca californiensis]SHK29428.1 type II restriction enzyme [Anaerobranca californiensis DSM 14826]
MKFLDYYQKMGLNNIDEVFEFFLKTLKPSNRTFDFFVDWAKIFRNIDNIEIELNLLNYLIGKENIKKEFKCLIKRYPNVAAVIPILVALREKNVDILVDFTKEDWVYKRFVFKKDKQYMNSEIEDLVEFADKTGILQLFTNKKIKNIVDYCLGLEVGLDTNGRKNRSGKITEDIVGLYIEKTCKKLGLEYFCNPSKNLIKSQWHIELPVDKTSRKYDFAINNQGKLILIETNFFGDGGSKLKSVAGEFIALNNYLKNFETVDKFIWITDGIGWLKDYNPLKESFINIDYLVNFRMVYNGILEEIISI